MRLLLVTNEYPPEKIAGTGMSTRFLAEALAARGGQVSVIVNSRRAAPPRERDRGVDVVRLRPFPIPATRMMQRAGSLLAIAQRSKPDIIQGQSVSCGALALLIGRCLGVPAVTYIQGFDLYHATRWARRTYVGWALTRSDGLVAVTDDLRRAAHDLSGRWAQVIPHGLRLCDEQRLDRRTARAQLGLSQEARLILFVGRLIAQKGVAQLIGAMARIAVRCPDARLIIVGGGENRDRLAALARELSLDPRIVFVGERPHGDVIRFMRAADVFVLPSLIEPFGIVLVEAMGCGLAVVASGVMGIPSIVEDGRNGLLVRPGDEAGLAEKIVWLLESPEARRGFEERNVRKAADYAYPRVAARFLDFWAEVLALRRHALIPTNPRVRERAGRE